MKPKRTRGWVPEETRQRVNLEKLLQREEEHIACLARKAFKGTTTVKFAEKAGVSPTTAQKFKDNPFALTSRTLLKCCVAARIVIGATNEE